MEYTVLEVVDNREFLVPHTVGMYPIWSIQGVAYKLYSLEEFTLQLRANAIPAIAICYCANAKAYLPVPIDKQTFLRNPVMKTNITHILVIAR